MQFETSAPAVGGGGVSLKASIGSFLAEMNQRGHLSSPLPPSTLTSLAKMTSPILQQPHNKAKGGEDCNDESAVQLKAALAAAEEKIRTLQAALEEETRRHRETRLALKNLLGEHNNNSNGAASALDADVTVKDSSASIVRASNIVAASESLFSSLSSPPPGAPGNGGRNSSPPWPRVHSSDHRNLEQLLTVVESRVFQSAAGEGLSNANNRVHLMSPGNGSGNKSPLRAATPTRGGVASSSPRHVGFGHGAPRFKDFVQVGDQAVFADSNGRRHPFQGSSDSLSSRERISPGASTRAAQLRNFLHASSPARNYSSSGSGVSPAANISSWMQS